MAKEVGIKAELRNFKRERIIQEMIELFAERGFHGATLDVLAERLRVTKPFVYQFFRSKEDLLVTVYERGARHIVELIDEALKRDAPPYELLYRFVYSFAHQNVESRAIGAVYLQEEKNIPAARLRVVRAVQKEFDDKLTALIARGIKQGEFDVKDPRLAAFAIIGMVRWIQQWYSQMEGAPPAPHVADHFAQFALRLVGYTGKLPKRNGMDQG